eukprot:COSAG02_NODE_5182_length_4563_cov_4.094982_3_plen_122_part_00
MNSTTSTIVPHVLYGRERLISSRISYAESAAFISEFYGLKAPLAICRWHCLTLCHRLAQKKIPPSAESTQYHFTVQSPRIQQIFEVIRMIHCIYQCVLRTPHDSNPGCVAPWPWPSPWPPS